MSAASLGDFIAEIGFVPPRQIDPGRWVRFATKDGRGDDGSALLFPDGLGGFVKNWASGESWLWQAKRQRPVSESEQSAWRAQVEAAKRQADELRDREQHEAAQRAAHLFGHGVQPQREHPYLAAKGIGVHGVRLYKRDDVVIRGMSCQNALMVPVRGALGLQSLEFISPQGEKRFLPGGRKAGGYYAIGKPAEVMCIVEGFATGASVHEATGHAVAVAFDAGNLVHVAKAMREKFPKARIVVTGDNDENGVGQRAAKDAALAVGGFVAVPAEQGADWNDVACRHGAGAVRTGIEAAVQPAREGRLGPPARQPQGDVSPSFVADVEGAEVLHAAQAFVARFVALPNEHCLTAVTLWAAHAHIVQRFHTSPRLALLSPEPASGKTRVLEVLSLLTPESLFCLNASPAAIFRMLAEKPITLLVDETDAIFSRKGQDDSNEDLRALLNAGYKRGAQIPRCVGPRHEVRMFPVYAATALAGLGDLPDTIMSRSIIVRMRRRAPGEQVEPFRAREHEPSGYALRDRLAAWAHKVAERAGALWPELPDGIVDRPAEVWEPLIAIADVAGGSWPEAARSACTSLASIPAQRASLGVRLLADLRQVFGDATALHTATIIERLCDPTNNGLEADAPWADLHGKPISERVLASMLRRYGVSSLKVKVDGRALQGYRREHLWDAWVRYLAPSSGGVEPMEPSEPVKDAHGDLVPVVPQVPVPRTSECESEGDLV